MERKLLILAIVTVLVRLLYGGAIYLLPEEAYYWRYAVGLDIGYLDHPPMVALSIYLGTRLFGTNEFGVRISALFWSFLAAVFVFRYARATMGDSAARGALCLFVVLPYFFGAGFFMTPDAPLLAFWAAALYFLHAALVGRQDKAWWGVALSLGLGLLSKYPIVLLGPAALVFLFSDADRRKTFFTRRPWEAAALALLIFSPVILWNYEHDWASFAFQSADRVNKASKFSLHLLIAHLFVVLTPAGLLVFLKSFKERSVSNESAVFIRVFTLVPLAVFVFFSLRAEVKVNWTGPVFLAFMPVLGASIDQYRRAWMWTVAMLAVSYLLVFHYLSFGLPGAGYPRGVLKFFAGDELAGKVLKLEGESSREGFVRPIVVGMDKHYLASQLGFYRKKLDPSSSMTAGRSLFGRPALMYHYWSVASDYKGSDMMLISRTLGDMGDEALKGFFDALTEVRELRVTRRGREAGRYYYRFARNFQPERVR